MRPPECTYLRPRKNLWDEVFLLWTPLDFAEKPVICNGVDGTKLDLWRERADSLRVAADIWRAIKLYNEKAAASHKNGEANGETGSEASAA
jgi:hypothetical protein